MLNPKAKRLRPAILIAVVVAYGQEITEKVLTLAASIELLHIASLIHDDIIDNADNRWSVATINAHEEWITQFWLVIIYLRNPSKWLLLSHQIVG